MSTAEESTALPIDIQFQKKLGRFFHQKNLHTIVSQYKILVNTGMNHIEAFSVVCKVFDAAKSEFIQ